MWRLHDVIAPKQKFRKEKNKIYQLLLLLIFELNFIT